MPEPEEEVRDGKIRLGGSDSFKLRHGRYVLALQEQREAQIGAGLGDFGVGFQECAERALGRGEPALLQRLLGGPETTRRLGRRDTFDWLGRSRQRQAANGQ